MRSFVLKKKVKSLLCFLLIFTLGAPSFAVRRVTAAEASATVYINGTAGSDLNSGLTEEAPVKTYARAYEAIYAQMADLGKTNDPGAEARIVLTGDTPFNVYDCPANGNANVPIYPAPHVFRVILTSKTGAEAFSFVTYTTPEGAATPGVAVKQAYLSLVGPTTFENITMKNTRKYFSIHTATAADLVIGENVTGLPDPSSGFYMSLVGSPKKPAIAPPSPMYVHSGTWQYIYAASYASTPTSGKAFLYMDGGTVASSIAPTSASSLKFDTEIHLKNVTIPALYAAHSSNGTYTYTGNVTLDLQNVTITKTFALDANPENTLNGDLYLSLIGVNGPVLDTTGVTGTVYQTAVASAAEGETFTLNEAGTSVYSVFNGGGNLVLGQDSTLKISGEVIGSTEFSVTGGPLNRTYIIAPLSTPDDAFVYTGAGTPQIETDGSYKTWSFFDDAAFKGIVLRAPADVTLTLTSGFSGGEDVEPDFVRTENGYRYQYYAGLSSSPGRYRYTASGAGYYTVTTALYASAAKMATRTEIDADPGLKAGTGWEQSNVTILQHSAEAEQNFIQSDDATWASYDYLFVTPSFNAGKAAHEFTTQSELLSYLASLDDASKDAYPYTLTTTVKGQALPIVVFTKTDLSQCATWEEAAALVKNNGKLTIHYQAQIHGNEPAGGEGALVFLTQLYQNDAWRNGLLDNVNLYIIPRVNPDGSQAYTRNNGNNVDMNRNLYAATQAETQAIVKVVREFGADVKIDAHEYTGSLSASGIYEDVFLRPGNSLNNALSHQTLTTEMALNCYQLLWDAGIRATSYPDAEGKTGTYPLNARNPVTSNGYQAADGSLSFLVETRGINNGRFYWKRRVVSQYLAIKGLIDQAAARAAEILNAVEAERDRLASFAERDTDPDSVFVLKTDISKNSETAVNWPRPTFNYATGVMISDGSDALNHYVDVILRSRPRATAYLAPRGTGWETELRRLLAVHTIDFYELEPGSAAAVRQYTGTVEEADLAPEEVVVFPNGAIVVPTNTPNANRIASLFEPDVNDAYGGPSSLAVICSIAPADGFFPIYRFEHALEADGSVGLVEVIPAPTGLSVLQPDANSATGTITGLDPEKLYEYRTGAEESYTAVPAGSTEITGLAAGEYRVRLAAYAGHTASAEVLLTVEEYQTPETGVVTVYLDPASGSDANGGSSADAPKKTWESAVSALDAAISGDPALKSGKIVLMGILTPTANFGEQYVTPAHSFPLTVTGRTSADGIAFNRCIILGGDETYENMTIRLTVASLMYFFGNGHRLEFGEGIHSVGTANSSGDVYYYNVVGGAFTGTVSGTDVTIRSGTWRSVYAGGYGGTVSGTSTASTVAGDAVVNILGGTITAYFQASYSRPVTGSVTFTLQNCSVKRVSNIMGNVSGTQAADVTFILKEGALLGADLYAGNRDKGTASGAYTLILDGADYSGTFHHTSAGTMNGSTRLILKSGTYSGTLAGIGEVIVDTSEGGELTLNVPVTASSVTGGGSVILGAGASLTVTGAVSGTTALSLTETPAGEVTLARAPAGTSSSAFSPKVTSRVEASSSGVLWIYRPVDPALLRISGRTLIFDSTFSVRYLLEKDVFDAYLDAGMTVDSFTVTVNEETKDLSLVIGSEKVILLEGKEYYWVKVEGIAPKNAATPISFSLTCAYHGETYSDSYTDSVKAALEQAAKGENASFVTAAKATLAYCAAAARRFGTDASIYSIDPVTPVTSYEEITACKEGTGEIDLCGTSLILKDELSIRFWARPGNFTGTIDSITVKVNGVEKEVEKAKNGSYFTFKIAVPIQEMKNVQAVELFVNSESVSNRYFDSVLNCAVCYASPAYGFDAAEQALGQAIIDYVHYTNEYLSNI